MNQYIIVAVCTIGLLITACSGPQNSPNQTGGMLVGGLAGGLLGSQFGKGTGGLVGAGLGTLVGAYAGSEVGRSMDQKAAPPFSSQYREDPRYTPYSYDRDSYYRGDRHDYRGDPYERDPYYRY
jgi:predicted lipid-binding transport protein (Tim44 family)